MGRQESSMWKFDRHQGTPLNTVYKQFPQILLKFNELYLVSLSCNKLGGGGGVGWLSCPVGTKVLLLWYHVAYIWR